MKTTAVFLADLYQQDVKLWLDAGEGDRPRLRCSAPEAVLTEALSAELQQRKPEIVALLQRAQAMQTPTVGIPRASREGTLPLSFAQQRLWFLEQLQPGTAVYHIPAAVRLTGALNIPVLVQALNAIVQRHEVLRTNFLATSGTPSLHIAPNRSITLPMVDLRSLNPLEQDAEIRTITTQSAQTPFNLATDPLLRGLLLWCDRDDHVLLLTLHHIVADGWSMEILLNELVTLYRAFSQQQPSPLPELPIQYADFALWQRQWLQGQVLAQQLDYWRSQLGGDRPVLQLPTDFPRSRVQQFRGAVQSFVLPESTNRAISQLAQAHDATLFMTLLSVYIVLLHRYTGQTDILVGCPIANRTRTEIEGLIGLFVNTIVLRTPLTDNPTFLDLLQRVRSLTWQAYDHQDLPFEKLVEDLQPVRDLSYNPLFQVKFRLEAAPRDRIELPGLTLSSLGQINPTAKLDLSLDMYETPTGLVGGFEYNQDLFLPETIQRWVSHFCTLLDSIVQTPDRRISELSLLSPVETQQILVDWNQTQVDYPQDNCFHQLFEQQVARTPDAIAIVFQSQHLTYRQLNHRSNQVAHYLQQRGVQPETIVGLCVERSPEMIVGLLGILKAGGAYLPLDPAYPPERLTLMLTDAQVPLLLTQSSLSYALPHATPICLDQDWEQIAQMSDRNPTSTATPDNLAYLIYTSGSTGTPKGVLIPHCGLTHLTFDKIRVCEVDATSCVLQFFSLSFDASVPEIIMPLACGGKLCLAPSADLLPGVGLVQLLQQQQVTHITITPSALTQLPAANLPDLKMVLVGGEAPTPELIAQWSAGRRFINAYGPTEVTVNASMVVCGNDQQGNGQPQLPTLRPSSNKQFYILDAHLQPVPIGAIGELYIAGIGLARGYLNRPDLTAERFIPNPFREERSPLAPLKKGGTGSEVPLFKGELGGSARLYKTGDRASYLPDGRVKLWGRADDQAKIRGFRIEPQEIERVLRQHPALQTAAVIVREDQPGEKRLVAYGVARSPVSISEVKAFLREKLPEYLVPSAIAFLPTLPLTPNGKLDVRSLPAPEQIQPETPYLAPRHPTEVALAAIFSQALQRDRVSIDEDFFDLGGHSLLATQLMAQVLQQFNVELSVMDLFAAPTIAGLAAQITRKQFQASAPQPDGDDREEIEI
jgi:amino acid adenylation domain-containing protein